MPNFLGSKKIILQPLDNRIPYKFHCTTNTSEEAGDGCLPVGVTITNCIVTATTNNGDAETGLIDSTSLSTPDITVVMNYPTNGEGRYHLRFALTLSNDATMELDFSRIIAENLG